MGCVASRLEEEEEVVSICRERKRQLKLAVERRYALADAHYRYCKSLSGVSAAINLFVTRHSSPNAPYYITFPPHSPTKEKVVSNPLFLQQAPSEPTKQTINACDSCSSSSISSVSSEEEEREKQAGEEKCSYFYMDMPLPQTQTQTTMAMASPQRDFGWDFFNPFNNVARPEMMSVYNRMSEEEVRAVREQEGIPDLEDEEGERMGGEREGETANVEEEKGHEIETVKAVEMERENGEKEKGLSVVDKQVEGRELLEALKDIEDHFVVAYDSGKDVSRMLECNRVHLQSNIDEIKENSTKLIQAITWKSASSRSSSCKSLVASGSKSSSTWTEFSNDLFDDYGGMTSGSHSLTLGRLYAWEKKLYDEVKNGDSIRKIYERKCNQLQNQDVRGDEGLTVDKSRAAVKDLYSRILVAIRSAETISKQIEKLIEEELEPQIRELLQGMTGTWKVMLESHEIQSKIIFEVTTFSSPSYGKFCNETHRLATLQLEAELRNWRSCFTEYVSAQKRYVEALFGWLSKFVAPEVEFYSRGRASAPPCRLNGPPLLVLCHDWVESMNNLPEKAVSIAIRSCSKDVRVLWLQQGEELLQKRKVDSLSKELDRKTSAFRKAENRMLELRLSDEETGPLVEGKDALESLRRRADLEKEKHRSCMLETERMTLSGFKSGFVRVFETMTEFSRAALEMYNELMEVEKKGERFGKQSCIESSTEVENGSR
ncbi:protein ALTERED PHOSPHATE STARVATION RESPONSE 1-like [Salvia miltiorrhiza]|uniref:protein ALTERED PHOSPHATE STARVATION RESPONSE 1-like n=1 Tax=Salvia miltiorrhiza TaxID=226208 RepID=UPI0025AC5C9F|nr:protein ALTERED PHOSPHATE STARVATION RESPONSE 1-like [Salvia miltiorrhiza]